MGKPRRSGSVRGIFGRLGIFRDPLPTLTPPLQSTRLCQVSIVAASLASDGRFTVAFMHIRIRGNGKAGRIDTMRPNDIN